MLGALTLSACGSSGTPSTSGSGATKLAHGCPSGGPGVTSSQISVAATVVDINSGSLTNATVGVPTLQAQETDWNTVASSINKAGGAGCRQIALHFYNVNPLDASAAQQSCLTIAATRPFIVLDTGALSEVGASNCIPAHQIPFASEYLTQAQQTQYHPYYLAMGDVANDVVRNGILGLNQLGYFKASKGFRKLGVLYHTCDPTYEAATVAALKQAGVPSNKVVAYNLGCPAGQQDTPASLEQAVLSFKNGGVTDVNESNVADIGEFTQIAQQQNYKPQYVLTDAGFATSKLSGALAPNPTNLNGGVDVIDQASGEQTTPGFKPTGGTAKCDAIFAAAGQLSVYKQPDGFGGSVCDLLWLAQAAADHAPQLQPTALATALHAAGTIDFSFPFAPINYGAAPASATYGVSYWRPIDFVGSCSCWQVPNPTFHQPFK